jgi:methylitaconate Delta-isomerase
LFGQVSVSTPMVDWRGTCGNLTTAVGPFAIDHGLVPAVEPITEVAIFNINTKKRVIARVPVKDGRALSEGNFSMPGIRGTGARIDLEFVEPAGTLNGHLLPTGKASEQIELEDGCKFTVSIVDAANVLVFCSAKELGLKGTELPADMEKRHDAMETLEAIRSIAAERLGIVKCRTEATAKSPGSPQIGFVSAPVSYDTAAGGRISGDEIDIVGRMLSMQTAHRAYVGAGGICTGAAAMTKGTIIHDLCDARVRDSGVLRIGHPQGVMDVAVKAADVNGETRIRSATIARTARRIMEGYAYVPESCFVLGNGD